MYQSLSPLRAIIDDICKQSISKLTKQSSKMNFIISACMLVLALMGNTTNADPGDAMHVVRAVVDEELMQDVGADFQVQMQQIAATAATLQWTRFAIHTSSFIHIQRDLSWELLLDNVPNRPCNLILFQVEPQGYVPIRFISKVNTEGNGIGTISINISLQPIITEKIVAVVTFADGQIMRSPELDLEKSKLLIQILGGGAFVTTVAFFGLTVLMMMRLIRK